MIEITRENKIFRKNVNMTVYQYNLRYFPSAFPKVFEKIINIDIPLGVKIYLDASIFDISSEQIFQKLRDH